MFPQVWPKASSRQRAGSYAKAQVARDGILTTKAMDVTLSPGTSEFTQVLDRNSECPGSGQPLNAAVSSP